MSQQSYSYPSVPKPKNNAYAAAVPKQQQRTGPIIVGGTTATATVATTAPAAAAAKASAPKTTAAPAAANAKAKNDDKKTVPVVKTPHPEGRYAGGSLATLGSYAIPPRVGGRKRSACAGADRPADVLDRLVPPLLLCAYHSASNDDIGQDGEGEGGVASKKMRVGNFESERRRDASVAADDNRSDEGGVACSGGSDDLRRLRDELRRRKRQNELLMERRSNVFKSMVALHEIYETGLDGISRTNDLRFVPDNVLPDKIPR